MTDQKPDTSKEPEIAGTVGAPNPKTGSADAARGLGGHSKDASHDKGAPTGYVETGKSSES